MRTILLFPVLLSILALALAVFAFTAKPSCAGGDCTRTFCGTSAECVGGCVCVVPIGRATGYCLPTR